MRTVFRTINIFIFAFMRESVYNIYTLIIINNGVVTEKKFDLLYELKPWNKNLAADWNARRHLIAKSRMPLSARIRSK